MCTPPILPGGRGWGALPTKFSKWGDLTGTQFLEDACWERVGELFQGGLQFYIKTKLKSEIFNKKKSL